MPLLRRYWRRFEFWLPNLLEVVGDNLGLSPPIYHHAAAWLIMRKKWGPMSQMTQELVDQYRITIFGRYRCHQSMVVDEE
jgi:hypothetical protein